MLKFERRGNKLYVWKVGFSKRSDGGAVQHVPLGAGLALTGRRGAQEWLYAVDDVRLGGAATLAAD